MRLKPAVFLVVLCALPAQSQLSTTPLPKDEVCTIRKNWTRQQLCDYISSNDATCEGGGYLLWSQYVECAWATGERILVIIGGVTFMLFMFVMISTAADDFFSPNVASIVAHLKISESVAGVTFMAFGNGAPDIFSSIASVLSSSTPKAGLALGELLGAGIFVTLVVVATIVLTSPFEVEAFSTVRDLLFYITTLGFILFVFLFANQIYLWEPCVLLGVYGIYVVTVIIGQQLYTRKRRAQLKLGSFKTQNSTKGKFRGSVKVDAPTVNVISAPDQSCWDSGSQDTVSRKSSTRRPSISFKPRYSIFPPVEMADMFGNEETDSIAEEVVVFHNTVYTGQEARSRAASSVPPPASTETWSKFLIDIYNHLRPLSDAEEWKDASWFGKILSVVKIVPMFVFKTTIPMSEASWSKAVAIIHAIFSPITLLFCLQLVNYQPFGNIGLWLYALGLSVILTTLLVIFTRQQHEPRYYKQVYSYLGFLMAIVWIYMIAAEVVNVVTMIGIVSGLSHEVLGLTILAWSNSIGDLIADVSVVRQGFPRMAMAAAIGGPLFNLLLGFGLPFLIADARGSKVSISFTPIYHILILFLAISLCTTLIGVFVQKFYVRRPYAVVLILIYIVFLVMVGLTETKVVVWGHE